jgi:hypothetical protein
MELIKLDDARRKEIGQLVYDWVQAGLATQGSASTWWDSVERFYRNERPSQNDVLGNAPDSPGYSIFHVPLSQPRQDMLTAQVCTVVGRQDPYMRDTESPEEIAEARQNILQRVWQDAKFEDRIRKAARITGNTDLAYLKMEPGYKPGTLCMEAYHCRNVVVYPALSGSGTNDAVCIGNSTSRRRGVVEDMQESGEYYKGVEIIESDPTQTQNPGESERSGASYAQTSTDRKSQTVNLWDLDVLLKLEEDGNKEQWYHCVIDEQGLLLSLARSKWSRPRWIKTQFIGSPTDYYPPCSVGRNLAPIQDEYNKLHSGFYAGVMRTAVPPMVGPKLTDGQKNVRYNWGSYVETDGKPEGWALDSSFNGAGIPMILSSLEQIADRIARISQNAQGGSTENTATEADIIAAGVAVGLEEYIANFTAEFGELAGLTLEMVANDYEAFSERYGEEPPALPIDPLAALAAAMSGADPMGMPMEDPMTPPLEPPLDPMMDGGMI